MRRLTRFAFPLALLLVALASFAPLPQQPVPAGSDKLEHAIAFAVLAALALQAGSLSPARLAAGLLAYGFAIECVQALLPWRDFSLLDWLADAFGVGLALVLARCIRARRPAPPP